MTFEEHIKEFNAADERLRLRFEALAQSLELTRLSNEEAHQRFEEEHRKTEESHKKTEALLRRAIVLSVREARAEREPRRKAIEEIDDKITKLASAQLVTETMWQKLDATVKEFIEGLRGKNGQGKPGQE